MFSTSNLPLITLIELCIQNVVLDSVLIISRARDVKTVRRITGVVQETQLLPARPAQLEKELTLDEEKKLVTAHGVSLFCNKTYNTNLGVIFKN